VQNLTTFAFVSEIRLWVYKLKIGHVTLTSPILGVVCHP